MALGEEEQFENIDVVVRKNDRAKRVLDQLGLLQYAIPSPPVPGVCGLSIENLGMDP